MGKDWPSYHSVIIVLGCSIKQASLCNQLEINSTDCHKKDGVNLFFKASQSKTRNQGWKLTKERMKLEP